MADVGLDIDQFFRMPSQGKGFTLFAPTNAAIARLTPGVKKQLANPQNYPLLLSLIRSHLVEVRQGQSIIPETGTATASSVEGYPLTVTSSKSGWAIDNGYYTAKIDSDYVVAENGIVHYIDRILDPLAGTFGVSAAKGLKTIEDQSPVAVNDTMTDLVENEPALTQWLALMKQVLPAILKRLGDRRGPEGKDCTTPHPFAVFPENAAFQYFPENYTKLLSAPFNFALSSHLLAWGISIPTCSTYQDMLKAVQTEGKFQIFSHRADINLTVTETSKGSGELMVNNARVVKANRCAGNGCIWIVDRFVDPVYGLF